MTVSREPVAADESRWGYRKSLASRVTLLTTMAVGLAVAFVAAGAYVTVRMQLQSALDDSLVDRAEAAAEYPVLSQLTADTDVEPWMLGAADVRIAFVRYDGQSRFLDQGEVIRLDHHEFAVARGDDDVSLRTVRAGGTAYRVVAVPTSTDGIAIVIAQSLEPQERLLTKLGLVTFFFGLAGMLAAGVAGWAVARNGLRPVRRLTTAVEEIARTEDLTPLPVEGDDEVARLATAFNQMLTSLAASRDRQRRLVADAGHELRTPLTSMRTNIDLLMQADAGGPNGSLSPAARAELLDDVGAQLEELSNLVGDLVELARDEPMAQVVGTVELHEVLDAAVARVRRRAGDVRFEVAVEPWYVEGEAGALERAVTNMLDNAAKWSPPGGVVRVWLSNGTLTVDDSGPGISDADLPHVFERFYRSPESRSMPGSGLGLSIVRQVAERHAGEVWAGRSPTGGARLVFSVPGHPDVAPPSDELATESLDPAVADASADRVGPRER
jgi:two-component system, OmpR family, sensor histidine kinase MprB